MTPHLRRAGIFLTVAGIGVILAATLIPEKGQTMDAHFCLVCGPLGGVDVVLNVLLFAPLGAGLALSGIASRRTVLAACVMSLLIEVSQFFFIPGRDASLSDVLTNTAGAALGIVVIRRAGTYLRPSPRTAVFLFAAWYTLWLAIQLLTNFAFAPAVPESAFYGEIAPQLRGFELFRGRVVQATVGGAPLSDALLDDPDRIRRELQSGALVNARVVPSDPPQGVAPIVRVADAEQREVVLVAQHERELLFGIYTGASTLRLRAPLFGLNNAFPDGDAKAGQISLDTVVLSASYTGEGASITARTGEVARHLVIPVSASLGWTLLQPAEWFIEYSLTERVVSWLWVAFLVAPLGYWATRATRSLDRPNTHRRYWMIWPATAGLIGIGLGLAPAAFSLTPTPFRDWLAALAGVLLGGIIAHAPFRQGRRSGVGDA